MSLRGCLLPWFCTDGSLVGPSSESHSGSCPVSTLGSPLVSPVSCSNPAGPSWFSTGIWLPTGWILDPSKLSPSVDSDVDVFFSDS